MKLTTTFLVFCVTLLSDSGVAFFVNSLAKPVAEPVAALVTAADAVAGAVPSLPLSHLAILRFILASLGIPLDPLIEGSRKCVTELGPEAVGAVKSLLVTWASFLAIPSLYGCSFLGGYPYPDTFYMVEREPLLPDILQQAIS